MQRVQDVVAAMKWIEKQDVNKINLHSVSTAKLGNVVVSALAGKKAKASAEDFLPFDPRKQRKENGVTDASLKVLKRLMKTRKMNGKVISMLADELKSASSRDVE